MYYHLFFRGVKWFHVHMTTSTMYQEELQRIVNETDEDLIILATVGGIIGIILLIAILIQTSYEWHKIRNERRSNSSKRPSFMASKPGRNILFMTYLSLGFYLCSCISMVFIRSTVISGSNHKPSDVCVFGWFTSQQFNAYAKSVIYTTFLYRLYVSFRSTANPIPFKQLIGMLSFLWIFIIILTISALVIISIHEPFMEVETIRYGIRFCGAKEFPPGFDELVLAIIVVEFIMNIYILYAFISRLHDVRKKLIEQFYDEDVKLSELDASHSGTLATTTTPTPETPRAISSARSSKRSSNFGSMHISTKSVAAIHQTTDSTQTIISARRILKLSRLIMKLTYLVVLTLVSGWIYWGISGVYSFASLLYPWDLIVNTICLWFLLSINGSKWNVAVKICYYPCLCNFLCPTIKEQKTQVVEKVIEVGLHLRCKSGVSSLDMDGNTKYGDVDPKKIEEELSENNNIDANHYNKAGLKYED